MWYRMQVNQMSTVLFISSVVYSYLAIEVCRDTDSTKCQSCGDSVYPRDEFYRHACMRSCDVCKVTGISHGKKTAQSSTYKASYSSKAVDGYYTATDFSSDRCSHTNNDKPSWWCIDLQRIYNINIITLVNRNDYQYRLKGFEIKLSSSGPCNQIGFTSATSCYKDILPTPRDIYAIERCNQRTSCYKDTIQDIYTIGSCNPSSYQAFSGRTVYVSVSSEPLTLCEVLISSVQCNTGYYSISSCTCQPCNTCYNNTCDPTNGVCTGDCKTGFYGAKCQQNCTDGCLNNQCDRNGRCTNCITGRYGDRCDKNCSTGCDGGCDKSTGNCTNCITGRYGEGCNMSCITGCDGACDRNDGRCTSCIEGKTGERCDINCNTNCTVCNQDNTDSCIECKDGRWGSSCNKLCNTNCKSVAGTTVVKCDHMTGNCINGCVPGKTGSDCTTEPLPVSTFTPLNVMVYVVSGVLGGILGTVAVFLACIFYTKRRQMSQPNAAIVPDLNSASSTTDQTLSTGYQNIPINTRNVDYVNQSFNTEENTRNMYDIFDCTSDNTQNVYTSIYSNKPN